MISGAIEGRTFATGGSLTAGMLSQFGASETGIGRSSGNPRALVGVGNPYTAARHSQSLPFNLTAVRLTRRR
jgi:hypothetical protein